jgi:hypothetical protein
MLHWVFRPPFGTYVSSVGGDSTFSAESGIALLMRCADASQYHCSVWLNSPPECVLAGSNLQSETNFDAAIVAYKVKLVSYGMVRQPGTVSYHAMATFDEIVCRTRKVGSAPNRVRARK